ncbi:MAG: helix-turn-helix transcriptional regulator [Devosia sp.]|uniref:helix-turn-helix domain-containing protein n=1 Tax=Devosia sp. TaxID=1871048 RepID=UPI0024CDD8B2|nr:helix-turn-helix transcriptional regulator [Devosia sp.]UYO00812.1 MAG: helix-turn-helix transcriptional regulator [Devosia sp.]
MNEISRSIGQALRNWRIHARIQQATIAECLGVTQSQVSRWESGRDTPRPHNIDAIRRLIWGPEAEPARALRHFVEQSDQHLMLIDADLSTIARSRPLRAEPNVLDSFGWVIDPDANPACAPLWRRLATLLAEPGGAIGLNIVLPFEQDGRQWCASLAMTIYSLAGMRLCLAEPRFTRSDGLADMRLEETRIAETDTPRQRTTIWQRELAS